MRDTEGAGAEHDSGTPRWAWFDRWTGEFIKSESYPALWDEMKTDEFKPIIVSWEGSGDV